MPRLTLRLFGPPRLELDGRSVETDRRKALALLAYLAMTRQSHTREALVALFWPEHDQSRGLANLRHTLWEINQAVGEGWVLADRETVSLNSDADPSTSLRAGPSTSPSTSLRTRLRQRTELHPEHSRRTVEVAGPSTSLRTSPATGSGRIIWLDVAQFQAHVAASRSAPDCAARVSLLTEAAALYQDHFLAGFSLKDAPDFDEWAFFQAEGLRREFAGALETLVGCHCEQGQAEAAIPFARRWLALDLLNEATHRQLMLVYEQAGQRNAALRQYQECARILREQLGAEPQPETTALYEKIRAGEQGHRGTGEKSPVLVRPSGTVTFLFTDIEGSTQLWEHHPEAMKTAFAQHEAIIRQTVTARGGYAYKMVGDAFQSAFATMPDALAAALEVQRYLQSPIANLSIRVRMALHTGVAEERGDDYVGPALNRVARLLNVGHGGQVLLTQAACELARDHLPEGARLHDLGEHRLKDLVRPEHIYQLSAPELPDDFPPLKTLDAFPHNLPVQLTSFIGREKEIAAVKQLLLAARLVTLTGPGGTGKTRLSLQIGAELLELFPDGVWLVELVPLADPALVPQTVANTLGVREAPGRPALTLLTDYLRTRNLLLILDNCEHLVEACAQLVEALLHACPHLFILASSREALGIAGESPFRVPSLSTPDPRKLSPVGAPAGLASALTHYEAVRLFVERVETLAPGFTITNQNSLAIAQVCHRLDGIPLAIELAAARARVLRVEQIVARLDDRFRLLTGGSRTALPRHQTLRALIDWSYDLLSEPERALLQRLSVFAGGWTLEAAEEVANPKSSQIPEAERRGQDPNPNLPATRAETSDVGSWDLGF